MANYILIDATNTILNIIDWDGIKDFKPPTGTLIQFSGPAGIGWLWDGTKATDPNPVINSTPAVNPITIQLAKELSVTPTQLSTALKTSATAIPVTTV